jgi:fructose-1-phosphate kinase PfkB-like protein
MGSKGAVAVTAESAWHAIPPVIKAVSTIGSGDSMIAGITYALSESEPLEAALRWGSASGAATAMTSGKEIASRRGIKALLDQASVTRLA